MLRCIMLDWRRKTHSGPRITPGMLAWRQASDNQVAVQVGAETNQTNQTAVAAATAKATEADENARRKAEQKARRLRVVSDQQKLNRIQEVLLKT